MERLLIEKISLKLAHSWFIGYDLDKDVPDHNSLSKIRERYGMQIFQQSFEQIVKLCVDAGLVWKALFFGSISDFSTISHRSQHFFNSLS